MRTTDQRTPAETKLLRTATMIGFAMIGGVAFLAGVIGYATYKIAGYLLGSG